LNSGSPPGASMTPSSDTNSVTTIRAAISRSPFLQLVAYRLLRSSALGKPLWTIVMKYCL
jgi:hypothetical protein